VLGDVAGMQLGAPADLGAIALDDDGKLHCFRAPGSGS
jgi:hypothetical protein